jgi:alpha-N-acetylglucosamine transferase
MSGTWAVYMNGTQETNWTSTSVTTLNGSGTMIYMPFSYSQALNNVYILSTSAYPEFASTLSSEVLATVLVAATLAAALFTVKLRSRKRKG